MPSTNSADRRTIASVQRALDILNLFTSEQAELGNAEIARMVGLPVGTASGLIYTLKANNYLDQNTSNRKYRLGYQLVERASVLLGSLDIRAISAPYLEEMRTGCGESVNLAVRAGNEVVYIERLFGSHSLGIRSELGKRGPLHSTALGKAISAFLPAAEFERIFEGYPFNVVTPYTITDAASFRAEMDATRANGYALDEQENELGGRCIGAPIFDHAGYPVAAVSVSVPIQRLPDAAVQPLARQLIATALKISQQIGYSTKINPVDEVKK
jgi:DNA-binding IclR family transcriptional regulator